MTRSWFSINGDRATAAIAVAVLAVLFASSAPAEEYRPWTGEFMRMGAGARAMGMGNAYTAVEGDVYSSYFNPAGLASMDRKQLIISMRYRSMDRHFKYMALGGSIGPDAGFGLSWINAGTDEITGRDANGRPTGSISDSRNAFTATFAKKLNDLVSFGVNTKLALWKLGGDDAKAFGFDIGLIARPIDHLSLAFVTRDLNSKFTWKSERWQTILGASGQPMEKRDKFPVFHTVGASYSMMRDRLLLAGTLEMVQDNPLGLDLGISYKAVDSFTVRAGMYNYTSSDELDQGSFTAGFTVKVTETIGLDYGFADDTFGNDSIHVVSLVLDYGIVE